MEHAWWRSEIHRISVFWMQVAGLARVHRREGPTLGGFPRAISRANLIYFVIKDADLNKPVSLVHKYGYTNNCFFWFSKDERARDFRSIDNRILLKMKPVNVDRLRQVLDYNPQIIEY